MGLFEKILCFRELFCLEEFLDLIYPIPEKCYSCGEKLDNLEIRYLCSKCLKKIDFISCYCQRCGSVISNDNIYCANCLNEGLFYSRTRSIALYNGLIRNLILRFKYDSEEKISVPLAEILALYYSFYFKEEKIDFIIPIPLHKNKEEQRGYNQVELLAKKLAAQTKIPLLLNHLVRVRDSLPLYSLSLQERKKVIKGCFALRGDLEALAGKNLLLLDDILTTGTTVNEASLLLREEGKARQVQVYTLARAKL